MDYRETRTKLAELFGTKLDSHESDVMIDVRNGFRRITIFRDGYDGVPFTFAQMMQLPAILGTEHLDFTADGHKHGTDQSGSYGHYAELVIVAKP